VINFTKLIKSFGFAFEGIVIAFKMNQNLRIHLIIAIAVLLTGLFFRLSYFEMILVIVMIILVFSAEMINTAIEEVVNLVVNEHRVEAKIAKDVCAAMTLVVSIGAFITGLLIFLPHIFK
jgi:diacylglycerol kinase